MINRLSILASIALALATPAFAALPMTVGLNYNSGVNPYTNTPLAAGSADLLFNLYAFSPAPTSGTATVVPLSQDGPGWVDGAPAQWIAPVENQSGGPGTGSPAGIYDYQGAFSSDFLVPTQVTVTGDFAGGSSSALFINGTYVIATPGWQGSAGNGFSGLTPINFTFTAPAGMFIAPVQFDVDDNATTNATNPTGLLVTNLAFSTSTGSSPEPSTWALLAAGAATLAFIQRRRLASSAR